MMERFCYILYIILLLYVVWFLPATLQDTIIVNVVPFHTIKLFVTAFLYHYAPLHVILANLLGNILLTIPLGIILYRCFNIHWLTLLILAFVIPLHIEFGQLLLHIAGYATRTVDIDDILLNGIGIGLGYFGARWMRMFD